MTHWCYGVSISSQPSESELLCGVPEDNPRLALIASILYSCCFLAILGDSGRLCQPRRRCFVQDVSGVIRKHCCASKGSLPN